MVKKVFPIFLILFLILSCSTSTDVVSNSRIQKRKYNKGLFVKKSSKNQHAAFAKLNSTTNSNPSTIKPNLLKDCSKLIASNNNISFTNSIHIETLIKEFSSANNLNINENKISKVSNIISRHINKNRNILNTLVDCDLIIMTDGSEVRAKILEITQYEIKYKNCNNLEGPTFTKFLKDIFKIKYANGTDELITNPSQININNNSSNNSTYSLDLEEGEKSQSIAIALWFLLGAIGVHRFYLGHVGIGVLYLLTFGLCGIGWLIDGILFLTGDLKPADGKDYGEKIL